MKSLRLTRLESSLNRVGALLSMLALVGCSARTGVTVPCDVPLRPVRPRVLLLVDHAYEMRLTDDGVFPSRLPPMWTIAMDTFRATIPTLDALGETGLYVYPRLNPQPPDDLLCAVDPDPWVPIGRDHVSEVLGRLEAITTDPDGKPALNNALDLAKQLLTETPAAEGDPFVVLLSGGLASCNASLTREQCECLNGADCYALGPSACGDTRGVRTQIEQLRQRGVTTIVLGLMSRNIQFAEHWLRSLNDMAVAGGVPRDDASRRYVDARDASETEATFQRVIGRSAHCTLAPTEVDVSDDAFELVLPDGARVVRDTTHTDGWDWTSASRRQLRLYGSTCERASQRPGAMRLSAPGQRCIE